MSDTASRSLVVYDEDRRDVRVTTTIRATPTNSTSNWCGGSRKSEMARQDEMQLAERDRDYYDHAHWTKAELDELKKRGQPPTVINKIHDKVSLLCGLERKASTDPKAFSRTPEEEDLADAATQALRYIADDNNFPLVRSAVFENMLIEGAGGAELGLEDDGNGGANITHHASAVGSHLV